jgi:uncharacterized membrane protein YbhN (UPF0104 family)
MKKLYSALKYVLLLVLAGILLYFCFREVKWSDFVAGLRSCNYWWIGASMIVGALSVLIRSERWRLIMSPLEDISAKKQSKVKAVHAWDALNIAYLTNFAVPRAGEITRCGVITKKSGLAFEKVVGTVVLERSFDMLCLIGVTFSLFVISWERFGQFIQNEILAPVSRILPFSGEASQSAEGVSFHTSGLLWLGIITFLAFAIFTYIIFRFREKHPILRKIADIAKGLLAGLISGVKMPQKWLFIIYTLLLWISYWLMSYTTMLSFPSFSDLGPADALFLMVVGSFGWVVPVQGGIGAYHLIVTLALSSVYAISQTTGIIFATISHESQAIVMLVLGAASLINVAGKRKDKKLTEKNM